MVFEHTDFSLNAIEQAKRAYAGSFIDLTSSNPTTQGLLFPPDVLESAAADYWSTRRYLPEPKGLPATRAAIQAWYAARTPPLMLDRDDCVVTASTSEAYSHLFALLTQPGDNVLAPQITYPLFQYLAELHHIDLKPYQFKLTDTAIEFDADSLLAQADHRTKAILLVAPHNPTGHALLEPLPELTRLGLPVICDEVFASFPVSVPAIPPLGALHPELPVFHLNGLSKMVALPDLKLGWIVVNQAARPWLARLELINDTFLSCSTLIQSMLPKLLTMSTDFQAAMLHHIKSNIDYALHRFSQSPFVRCQKPVGGYYLFPHIIHHSDDEQLVLDLLDYGVFVHPGYFYDHTSDCRLMLSCLAPEDRFAQGIERLLQGLEMLQIPH